MKYEEFYQDIYNNNISMDTGSSSVSFMILSAIEQVLFELLSRINVVNIQISSIFLQVQTNNLYSLTREKLQSGSKFTWLTDKKSSNQEYSSWSLITPIPSKSSNPSWFPSPKFRTSAKLLPDHSCSHSTAYLLQNTGCLQTDNKGEVIICILSNFIKHFILITT